MDPPFREGFFNNGVLNALDPYQRIDDSQSASRLAGRRTYQPGKFREIIGSGQAVICFSPKTVKDQVIPLRNQIVDWTTSGHALDQGPVVAEGSATIHAARRLGPQPGLFQL
jgi:hypothetical protein